MTRRTYSIRLADETATMALAARLAAVAKPGDAILLSGPIGAGKSSFARAFIRARLGNPAEDVPSPTFTLVQTYAADDVEIWHCDLYRLSLADDLIELGLEDAFGAAICLIEWPDRLGELTPSSAIQMKFEARQGEHVVTIEAPAHWFDALDQAYGP